MKQLLKTKSQLYFFIIQLFYCLNLNYISLVMFEKYSQLRNPLCLTKLTKDERKYKSGPFLFQNVGMVKRETHKRSNGWNEESNLKYLACIYSFKDDLGSKSGRDLWEIFKMMSLFIKQRNSNQCRIHHKRMIRQHSTIDEILSSHSEAICQHSTKFRQYLDQLKVIVNFYKIGQAQQNFSSQKSVIANNPNFLLPNKDHILPANSYGQQDKKDENIPTDVGYPQQASFNNKSTNKRNYDHMRYYPAPQHISESYFESMQSIPLDKLSGNAKKEQLWQQCHELFLAWTSKLKTLLES